MELLVEKSLGGGGMVNYKFQNSRNDSSLAELCCFIIVRERSLTERILPLPYELHCLLMRTAILKGRVLSVKILLEEWPEKVFSLSSLLPELHSIESRMPTNIYKDIEKWKQCVNLLVNSCINSVKKKKFNNLRILDVSSIILEPAMLLLILEFIMNENRRYKSMKQTISCEPLDHYVIYVYCHLDQPIPNLVQSLLRSSNCDSSIKLVIKRIYFTFPQTRYILKVLKAINPQDLKEVTFQYKAINVQCFKDVRHMIERFETITSLDLSENWLSFYKHEIYTEVAKMIGHLPNLSSLDLHSNNIAGSLNKLFSVADARFQKPSVAIEKCQNNLKEIIIKRQKVDFSSSSDEDMKPQLSLQRLNIDYSGITALDLKYLAQSRHASTLKDLNLGFNDFSSSFNELVTLLNSVAKNLVILELPDCKLKLQCFCNLFKCIRKMKRLQMINVCDGHLTTDILYQLLLETKSMENLRFIKMSYPVECFEYSNIDQYKEKFLNEFNVFLKQNRILKTVIFL